MILIFYFYCQCYFLKVTKRHDTNKKYQFDLFYYLKRTNRPLNYDIMAFLYVHFKKIGNYI